MRPRFSYGQRHVVSPRYFDLPTTDPERARAVENVDRLLVGEVVVVGPRSAPRWHPVVAATQLLDASGRTELLAAVAEPFAV